MRQAPALSSPCIPHVSCLLLSEPWEVRTAVLTEESGAWGRSRALKEPWIEMPQVQGFVLENQKAEQLPNHLTLSDDRQVLRASQDAVGSWAPQACEAAEGKQLLRLNPFGERWTKGSPQNCTANLYYAEVLWE